jgi:hypothetical protein
MSIPREVFYGMQHPNAHQGNFQTQSSHLETPTPHLQSLTIKNTKINLFHHLFYLNNKEHLF